MTQDHFKVKEAQAPAPKEAPKEAQAQAHKLVEKPKQLTMAEIRK